MGKLFDHISKNFFDGMKQKKKPKKGEAKEGVIASYFNKYASERLEI